MSHQSEPKLPGDPLGTDEPHDVLAAEEFAMPMRSRSDIPSDPIQEPHDVLAAEEFAMPTGGGPLSRPGGIDPRTMVPALALLLLAALLVRRARR